MNNKILYPIIIALVLCLGMIIVVYVNKYTKNDTESFDNTQSSYDKLNAILNLLDQSYVDNIDRNKLTEDVLPEILSNLDPTLHTFLQAKLKKPTRIWKVVLAYRCTIQYSERYYCNC